MDRPMGPRSQPDRHNVAYESIFGRPSALHHQGSSPFPPGQFPPPQPQISQPQVLQSQPPQQFWQRNPQFYSQPQHHSPHLDRSTSHALLRPSPSANYTPQIGQSTFRQSSYQTQPQTQTTGSPQPYAPSYNPSTHSHSNSLGVPSIISRTRSVGNAPGIIRPTPEEPLDPNLEALTRQGLTPAQAYQAQVNMNHPSVHSNPPPQLPQRHQSLQQPLQQQQNRSSSHSSSEQISFPNPGDLPRLGVNIDANNGRLDIDFALNGSALSDQPEDESELPWNYTSTSNSQSRRQSQHDSVRSRVSAVSNFSTVFEQHQQLGQQQLPARRQSSPSSSYPVQSNSGAPHPESSSSSSRPYPLQLDTAAIAAQGVGAASTSPASSTLVEFSSSSAGPSSAPIPHSANRKSSESSKTLPGPPFNRRERATQDRSRSMSATVAQPHKSLLENNHSHALTHAHTHFHPHPHTHRSSGSRPPVPPLPGVSGGRVSPASHRQHYPSGHAHHHSNASRHVRRTPVVPPALISRVAQAFKDRIALSDRVKDGLTYKDSFDGREAVDKIAYIIKTTDRNLALLYGRALDAQKFFHAVTYDHRLRDSSNDIYQFKTKLPSPFVSGELQGIEGTAAGALGGDEDSMTEGIAKLVFALEGNGKASSKGSPSPQDSDPEKSASQHRTSSSRPSSPSPPDSVSSPTVRPRQGSISSTSGDDVPLPSGVFTLLTDCYSPTCSRDRLCYSIACPRRLEQQSRLNMKPQPGLRKQISKESLGDLVEPGTLWIHSVPQEVVNNVSDTEKKRQEAINEVIYTERDFVRDMEYLRDLWIKPLKESDIIPESRRADFLEQVFWNIHDIIAVNTRLRDALNKRQKSYAVVEQIGDIFLDAVPHFAPFVSYGAHQLYGKYEFEKEKSTNPAFAHFVEETERRPESRKLELNGYLTKPTTRLARYPLLLEAVNKHTPADNPDKAAIPKAVEIVRNFLKAVNAETGKAENRFNLLQLDQQLFFRPGEFQDLRLQEEGRQLIYKGALKKRGNAQGDSADLLVFLFDHALLMVKQKSKAEQYKVYRKPIPLELLLVSAPDEFPSKSSSTRQKQTLVKNSPHTPVVPVRESKGGFSITFVHLGRCYYQISLWASTYVSQKKWVEHIVKQQEVMRERSTVFETVTLSEGYFLGSMRVNCAAPFGEGRRVVYGTDDGVYLSNLWDRREPVKVLSLKDVSQVDVLEDYQLLIVLSERQVITFPLDALDPNDPLAGLKRAKRIASHISFFKAGVSLGKTLVCVIKTSPLSSTIKTLEPIDQNIRGRSKPTFKKLLQGGNDTLRVFKEFYIPVQSTSIHFLKTKLCVGCTNGFEIVDLETLDVQGLLDPADMSLEFVRKRDNLRPLAIYRIDNEFLLCYDEFAFYVNKTGWLSRKEFMIRWQGSPTGFALNYPFVLAFEPTFVEVWHVETGETAQIIQGNNLRLLFADTPPSTTNSANNNSQQVQYNMYPAQQPVFNHPNYPYGVPPPNAYNGRPSLQNGHGVPYQQPVSYQQRPPHLFGRDEILVASDDRIMRLQMVAQTSQ